ncbi:MAG TPA: cupredoxin domain-containing protein [Kofleriaceae bacterium]|nr:cupredoxin domain-containing protein [Kofleriaceae bacterium]
MRCELLAITFALALVGCEKKAADNKSKAPPPAAPTVQSDGTRSIPINVNDEGFDPSKITAKPGEKLELVFTRRTKSECGSQVKVADGAVTDLPIDQPTKIAITAPPSGQLSFACGMDMMSGVVVVN